MANRRLLPVVPIPAAEAQRPAVLQVAVVEVVAVPAPAAVAEAVAVAVAVAPTLAAVVEVAAAEVVRTTNQQRCFVPQSAGATCAEMCEFRDSNGLWDRTMFKNWNKSGSFASKTG